MLVRRYLRSLKMVPFDRSCRALYFLYLSHNIFELFDIEIKVKGHLPSKFILDHWDSLCWTNVTTED